MALRAPEPVRFLVPLACVLLSADAAQAQRVPEFVVWSAGAALFAPFVAVPVKIGIFHLQGLAAPASGLWLISAIEWLLWFPLAFLLIRSGRSSELLLTLLALFFAASWLHKVRMADLAWRSAFLLALPTPILALALPVLAICAVFLRESLAT